MAKNNAVSGGRVNGGHCACGTVAVCRIVRRSEQLLPPVGGNSPTAMASKVSDRLQICLNTR